MGAESGFGRVALLVLLLTLVSMSEAAPPAGEVRVYNWLRYLPEEVLRDFERDTGIHPHYVEFDSAQAMENKLLTGNSGYDVVFPGSSSLRKLIVAGALQPLQHERLGNMRHLDGAFLQSLEAAGDPGNRYAVPYLWGATLIGYDADRVEPLFGGNVPSSWDLLFKPENLQRLASCGVGIIDAPDEILPIALHYLGLDPNSPRRADYRAAQQLLQGIRPYVRYFDSQRYGDDLANGTLCLAVGWSGGFVQARQMAAAAGRPLRLQMIVPPEGAPFWSDVMVVAAKAPNPNQAHAFIDYLLRPDVIARISQQMGYPAPSSALLVQSAAADDSRLQLLLAARQQLFFTITPVPEPVERIRARVWRSLQPDQDIQP